MHEVLDLWEKYSPIQWKKEGKCRVRTEVSALHSIPWTSLSLAFFYAICLSDFCSLPQHFSNKTIFFHLKDIVLAVILARNCYLLTDMIAPSCHLTISGDFPIHPDTYCRLHIPPGHCISYPIKRVCFLRSNQHTHTNTY